MDVVNKTWLRVFFARWSTVEAHAYRDKCLPIVYAVDVEVSRLLGRMEYGVSNSRHVVRSLTYCVLPDRVIVIQILIRVVLYISHYLSLQICSIITKRIVVLIWIVSYVVSVMNSWYKGCWGEARSEKREP